MFQRVWSYHRDYWSKPTKEEQPPGIWFFRESEFFCVIDISYTFIKSGYTNYHVALLRRYIWRIQSSIDTEKASFSPLMCLKAKEKLSRLIAGRKNLVRIGFPFFKVFDLKRGWHGTKGQLEKSNLHWRISAWK